MQSGRGIPRGPSSILVVFASRGLEHYNPLKCGSQKPGEADLVTDAFTRTAQTQEEKTQSYTSSKQYTTLH